MEKFGSSKHFREPSKFGGCSFGRENCSWKLEEQTNIRETGEGWGLPAICKLAHYNSTFSNTRRSGSDDIMDGLTYRCKWCLLVAKFCYWQILWVKLTPSSSDTIWHHANGNLWGQ